MFTNGRIDVHDAERPAARCRGLLEYQAAVWYKEGISKLLSRYDKCLNVQGDYVEK